MSRWQIFLNVEADTISNTWGVLVKINSEDELKALDFREALYERVDITKFISTVKNTITAGDKVYTYISSVPRHKKSQVFYDYFELCCTSALIYGTKFFNLWKKDLIYEFKDFE